MAGQVYVDNQKADKPGDTFPEDALVEVRGKGLQYVSRGGLKLEKAMKEFGLTLTGKPVWISVPLPVVLLTVCCKMAPRRCMRWMLDTGSWLGVCRTDPRVGQFRAHQRPLPHPGADPEEIGFFSVDVSFISLEIILPAVRPLLGDGGQAVCLIKPQFEAGREKVGKKALSGTSPSTRRWWRRSAGLLWRMGIPFWG